MSMGQESILQEAERLINGDRNAAYGDYSIEASRIAGMWSTILRCKVRPADVPLCMIAVKIVRETHCHKRDNITDIAGYAALSQRVAVASGPCPFEEAAAKSCGEYWYRPLKRPNTTALHRDDAQVAAQPYIME